MLNEKGKQNCSVPLEKVFWKTKVRSGVVFRCSGYDFCNVFLWSQFFEITPPPYRKMLFRFLLFIERQLKEVNFSGQMEGVISSYKSEWKTKIVVPSFFRYDLVSKKERVLFLRKNIHQSHFNREGRKKEKSMDHLEDVSLVKLNKVLPLQTIVLTGQKKSIDEKGIVKIENEKNLNESWINELGGKLQESYRDVENKMDLSGNYQSKEKNNFVGKNSFYKYFFLGVMLCFLILFLIENWVDWKTSTQEVPLEITQNYKIEK